MFSAVLLFVAVFCVYTAVAIYREALRQPPRDHSAWVGVVGFVWLAIVMVRIVLMGNRLI